MLDNTIVKEISQEYNYEYVTDAKRANQLLASLDPEKVYALDFETTSLAPEDGKIRLSSICGKGVAFVLDHFKCGSFESYANFFSQREWAVFNACFEGDWIDYNSDNCNAVVYDIQHMKKAKMGGGPTSLKIMAKQDLKIDLVKDEQNSNWSAPNLTQEQLDYAFKDAAVTWKLYTYWLGELTDEQYNGFMNINEAWRGTVEMQATGLILDVEYHKKLLKWWELKHKTAYNYLRRWTDESIIANLNSNKQISEFLTSQVLDDEAVKAWPKTGKTGVLKMEKETLRQAAYRLPYPVNRWVAALIILHKQATHISTYGQTLIDAQQRFGKISTRFNMAQAITTRYSSSKHNLQNIPNNPVVRRSFIAIAKATPISKETKLVMADYSSIEIRVLAELAHDKLLLEDAIYGNPHARSASAIFKVDYDYFTKILDSEDPAHQAGRQIFKTMRTKSKFFTFRLTYGAGVPSLAIALKCSDEEAAKALDAWATLYPKAYGYRQTMFETMRATGFLPLVDGGSIYVIKPDRTMPVAANYPVQGAAARVMYRAVYHAQRVLHSTGLRARLAATVHDELLAYSRAEDAEETGEAIVKSMVQGWLDIFPGTNTDNLVGKGNKATIGWHWGMKQ